MAASTLGLEIAEVPRDLQAAAAIAQAEAAAAAGSAAAAAGSGGGIIGSGSSSTYFVLRSLLPLVLRTEFVEAVGGFGFGGGQEGEVAEQGFTAVVLALIRAAGDKLDEGANFVGDICELAGQGGLCSKGLLGTSWTKLRVRMYLSCKSNVPTVGRRTRLKARWGRCIVLIRVVGDKLEEGAGEDCCV